MNDLSKILVILFVIMFVADLTAVTVGVAPTVPQVPVLNVNGELHDSGAVEVYGTTALTTNSPIGVSLPVIPSNGTNLWYIRSNGTDYIVYGDNYADNGGGHYTIMWNAGYKQGAWDSLVGYLSYAGAWIVYAGAFMVWIATLNFNFMTFVYEINTSLGLLLTGIIAIIIVVALVYYIRGTTQ